MLVKTVWIDSEETLVYPGQFFPDNKPVISGKELELDVLKVYPDCLSQPLPVLSLNATLGPRVVHIIPRIPTDSTQTSVKDNFPYRSWWEMGFSLMLTV